VLVELGLADGEALGLYDGAGLAVGDAVGGFDVALWLTGIMGGKC